MRGKQGEKNAASKPKGPHPSALGAAAETAPEGAWGGTRLLAAFEWDFPARLFPTRRDGVSEECSDAMDSAVVEAIRESCAMAAPGAPTEALLDRQREFHGAYGRFLRHNLEANSVPVSCGRGCGRCCHHFVTSVHALEVLSIYESLRRRPDLEDLIGQCRSRVDDFDGWKTFCEETYPERTGAQRDDLALEHYYDEGNRCPFLGSDGACGVYEDRPMTCRMYIASSPKEFCEPEMVTDDGADIFTVPADESVAFRLERLDRAVDYWGHSPDLFRSLARLHDWRTRWDTATSDSGGSSRAT
jgi:Fe-S-cluster containining protein